MNRAPRPAHRRYDGPPGDDLPIGHAGGYHQDSHMVPNEINRWRARCGSPVMDYGIVGYCTMPSGHGGDHYNDNAEPRGVQ